MPDLITGKRRRLFGAGGLLCVLLALGVVLWGSTMRSEPLAAANPPQWEDEAVRLTNIDRTSNGLNALLPHGPLIGVARERSTDMLQRQYFSHQTPDGKQAGDMLGAQGIAYQRWGENIGYSSGHDNDIVSYMESKWMASEGHRANILNPAFTHVGPGAAVGIYRNVSGVKMFTVLFLQPPGGAAAPPPQPPATPASAPPPAPTPTPPPAAVVPAGTSRTFEETGKTVKGLFLEYWNTHGRLAQQGYPISEEFDEVSDLNGKSYRVQYFERAVFEYHPQNSAPYNVLLSQLGTYQYKKRYPGGAPNQQPNKTDGKYFAETGHWVGGRFWQYWQQHGGLDQQGYPISEEFDEVSELDGKTYRVQYFERAVFEYHPENSAPNDVLLSQLGTYRHRGKYAGR